MDRYNVAGMYNLVRVMVSFLGLRFRSRAILELENLALRHQLHVLHRQRPGRPRLFAIDRLFWVWLYRLWPLCVDAMVLVKPPPWSNGIARASACFGVGVRGQDDRQ